MGSATPVVIEVTNTLQARSVTGYQRVVRELVAHLREPGAPALDVLPVVWDAAGGCFRRLRPSEERELAEPATERPQVAVSSFPGKRLLGAVARTPAGARLRGLLTAGGAAQRRELAALRLKQLPPGAVFFDLEPSWHDPELRSRLLPRLKAEGVRVVTMVADVLPETHPEWFDPAAKERFSGWVGAQLRHADALLTISEASRRDLEAVASRHGVACPPTEVLPLGADFGQAGAETPVALPFERYLLVVSTLEPRKNQALAVDVLEDLHPTHPDVGLVLVGRQGWRVDDLVARLESHPLRDHRLCWLQGISDTELFWLYRHAFLVLAPSFSEGLGLPVLEALQLGVPAISSDGGALPEAGAGLTELLDPRDLDGWVAAVRRHLDDPGHHARVRQEAQGWTAPTWELAAQRVREALGA